MSIDSNAAIDVARTFPEIGVTPIDPARHTPWGGPAGPAPLALLEPRNVDEVVRIVRFAGERRIALVPQGGLTGLAGGATPSRAGAEIAVSLRRMARIRELDPENASIVVEAGATLDAVDQAAARHGLGFPLRIGSSGSAQIGGALSTNAGGLRSWRRGGMRKLTLGIEAVLPDGSIWSSLRGVRKGNTGIDVGSLLIGAEGVLGFITAAALELDRRATARETAFFALPDVPRAIALFRRLAANETLEVFELISREGLTHLATAEAALRAPFPDLPAWGVLAEWNARGDPGELRAQVEADLEMASAVDAFDDAILASSERERDGLWALRERHGAACRRFGKPIQHDIAVPVSRIDEFISIATELAHIHAPGLPQVPICHVGDGNVHFDVLAPLHAPDPDPKSLAALRAAIHDLAQRLGGVFSAEHGIGIARRDELRRISSPENHAAMRAIKALLDPHGMMNPGKVL